MKGAYNSVCKSRLKKLSGSGHELVIMKEKIMGQLLKRDQFWQKRAVVFSFYTTCLILKLKLIGYQIEMENYLFILKTIEIPLLKISERKPEKILQKSKMGNAIFFSTCNFLSARLLSES